MLPPPIVHGDIPNITADWEWGENNPSDITISALQRAAWKSQDGKIVRIFVNVSNQSIDFRIPNDDRTDEEKILLEAYSIKFIRAGGD